MVSRDDPLAVLSQWISQVQSSSSGSAVRNLVTDDPRVEDGDIATLADRIRLVEPVDHLHPVEEDEIENSQFGRLIEAAMELVGESEITWVHSRFLTRCWDAPRAVDCEDDSSLDEDDIGVDSEEEGQDEVPFVFDSVSPPQLVLANDSHPDLVTAWMRTYGCQIRLVDLLTEVLLQSIVELDPMVVIAGTSGFALGQHGYIGHRIGPLRHYEMRLPMIVSDLGPIRCSQVTSSDQFGPILSSVLRGDDRLIDPARWSESMDEYSSPVVIESNRAVSAISTHGWSMVVDDDGREHLYLKPDDVDDANDVSRLQPNVVVELKRIANGHRNDHG